MKKSGSDLSEMPSTESQEKETAQNQILLRFNTEHKGSLFWRVIIEGKEYLADEVIIWCPSHTSCDKLPNNVTKFHICCYFTGYEWEGTKLIIN